MVRLAVLVALLAAQPNAWAQSPGDARSLEELRNTVVNLLEALVQKGVMTKEQAEAMVSAAQDKAAQDAKARSDRDAQETDAVRVTYVPEVVRRQIGEQVSAEHQERRDSAGREPGSHRRLGRPGALPEWIKAARLYGDVRARAEGDLYASDNVVDRYLDFNVVNDRGGISRAGETALLNTTRRSPAPRRSRASGPHRRPGQLVQPRRAARERQHPLAGFHESDARQLWRPLGRQRRQGGAGLEPAQHRPGPRVRPALRALRQSVRHEQRADL